MREAYFSVGDPCILDSKIQPEFNGPVVVTAVRFFNRPINRVTREKSSPMWVYGLNVEEGEIGWAESSLKKRHDPSEFTFEQLIKQEVPVDEI